LSVQALSPGTNKELRLTLGDINAMGWLGRYYAEKIRGAVDLYRYQSTGLTNHYTNARAHLITASNNWSQYSALWSTQYVKQVLTRMGLTVVDIAAIQTQVNADIPAPLTIITNTPGSNSVMLVVGDAASLGAADTAIRNRLQSYGFTVEVVSDESATSAEAIGKALVITSSTVASGTVNTKFRDIAVPVINWETFLQDDYRFTADADTARQNAASQTTLTITNPGHPLAAGLPAGNRVVATASGDFSWGEPGGRPTIIARLNDGSNHPCLYAYEAGAAMSSGTAPARRVHLFLQNNTFSFLNADGLKLFDAAVGWAAPVRFQPPVLEGGRLRLEWVGGGTLQTTTNVAGPWSDVFGASSPFLADTTNSAQFFRVRQ
jgi:hypothetical protein